MSALPRVAFITLGCKANQADTSALMALIPQNRFLLQEGTVESLLAGPAEIFVINTCAVTHKSAFQSRQMVRRARRANRQATVIAIGCLAKVEKEALRAAGADLVFTPAEWTKALSFFGNPKEITGNFFYHPAGGRQNRARAIVKIQDGCDSYCAYCIVPFTRGRPRSLPPETVKQELKSLAEQGFSEAVLTGIHLGLYGQEVGFSLARLLHELSREKGMPTRIRLSSIEPQEVTTELLTIMTDSPLFCPHFHLPLQSGDRQVLSRMRRPYSPEQVQALVEDIASRFPHAGIGLDLIAGFPAETQAEHENTLRLVSALPVSYLHVFPFSPRPGTAAATMKDQLPPAVIKQRAKELRDLAAEKKKKFLQAQKGRELMVLVESWKEGMVTGTSENYVRVKFVATPEAIGSLAPVRVEKVSANFLLGSCLDPASSLKNNLPQFDETERRGKCSYLRKRG